MSGAIAVRVVATLSVGSLALLLPWMTSGSASTLPVDGGRLHHWTISFDWPVEPPPEEELGGCGPLDRYDIVITGTPGDDVLGVSGPTDGNRSHLILGMGGNDTLSGGNGADCLVGGEGNDRLLGNNAIDILIGGAGDDYLDGGNADDVIDGGAGGDTCDGGRGEDTIINCELLP